ncbi:MAG TPA: ATP-binding protein [Methylosinus sp.]|jgi:signal transduction histidine kinase/CheY-like chemotaxis protein/purine-cytosine permease-like protein|uniref:hybrid sensor histidine kinase/response regulator n=1 Tax=Methylosinus sp. TaxID=427 RepID=UPI002F928976
MTAQQRIVRVRRDYNKWVADQTLEDYALRFTAERARRWSAFRVANTAIASVSFLALEAIGASVTLTCGFTNAVTAIIAVSAIIFVTCMPIAYYAARYGMDIDLLTRGAGFGYLGSTVTSIIYASFTFIFFAIEAAIMAKALEAGLGVPESIGYLICAFAVLPIVTHGFTSISRFQMWTQPLWLLLHIAPFAAIALQDHSTLHAWRGFTGRLGPIDGGWDITLFGAASGVVFALAAQIGEQVDFLRFLPRAEVAGKARWWISLIAAGPGWIVIGAAKMLAGSFLAYLAFKHGVPPDAAADPTQMYLVAFGYVVHDDTLALGLATTFVIVSQLKINVTNSYAGSIAWSNFFSRLTHSHPGRVVWLVFNIVIAVVLIELGIYRAIEGILGFYAHVAVAWIGALFADLAINKPLGLSPKGIEFKRAYLYEINPVGFGATLFASLVSIAAHFGAFGEILRAMSCYLALVVALAAAPLIAVATRGRFYIARRDDPPAMAEPQKCCICEHEFEPQDMAACPAYAGPICSLCCTLDARCHDSCKVDARFADQLKSAFSRFVPEGVIAMLGSNSGRYVAIFTLIICLLGGALSLVYWQAVLDARISPSLIGPPLAKAFVILSVISGIIAWFFVLVQESRLVAQEETQRQTTLLMQEIEAHQNTDRALQKAKEAAEAANIAKSRYVVGLSHEFRTPLNAILGYVQLLERRPKSSPSDPNALRTIRRSAEHLASLVDGLLDIAKIEAGRMEVHRDHVRLPALLRQVVDMFRLQAEAKGVAFRYETRGRLPNWVRIDEKRLRQILLNLLSNAVKFTEIGEVRFTVVYDRDMATFEIEDTGPGIPLDQHERIFRPFERLESIGRKWAPGTGLGLTITKLMTEVLGGNISLRSRVDHGSAFSVKFYLPESLPPITPSRPDYSLICGYQGARITIVVADDEASHRQLVARLLDPLGFVVFTAPDGDRCLKMIEQVAPQLVLLDVNMPGLSGWEIARTVRQRKGRDVAIVMLSADAEKELDGDVEQWACDGYIVKPFKLGDLLDLIAATFDLTWRFGPLQTSDAAAPRRPLPIGDIVALAEIGHARGVAALLKKFRAEFPHEEPLIETLSELANEMKFDELVTAAHRSCGHGEFQQHEDARHEV